MSDQTSLSPAQAANLVELGDLIVRFKLGRGDEPKKAIVAVDHVNLVVRRGRSLGLVGATGSGKSTVAQVIVGMIQPTSGQVTVAGQDLSKKDLDRSALRRVVQVVLQDPYSSLDPRMRVGDIIAEPLTLGRLWMSGKQRREIRDRVTELLGLVGLKANRAERFPHEFSGGQRQRIAIARALAPRPQMIVLDEPTSALDVSVRAQILTLLKNLQSELGVTYVVISHDLVTVAFLAAEVGVMHLGRIVELGPTQTLFEAPRHPYTLELLASAPGASGDFLASIDFKPVAQSSLPDSACRYAYRCVLRERLGNPDRCLEQDPELVSAGPDHSAACHFSDRFDQLNVPTERTLEAVAT